MPKRLLAAIEAGAEKTTQEWADEFHVTVPRIRHVCVLLRKYGFLIYPIGTKKGFGYKQGILKLLKSKMEFYSETMGRHYKDFLNPALVSATRQIEEGLMNYPQLAPVYKDFARELLVQATLIEGEFKNGNHKRLA